MAWLGDDFQSASASWNLTQMPPPPIINLQSDPMSVPPPTVKPQTVETDEEKQRREGMKIVLI